MARGMEPVRVVNRESSKTGRLRTARVTLAMAIAAVSVGIFQANAFAADSASTPVSLAPAIDAKPEQKDARLRALAARIDAMGTRIASEGHVAGLAIAMVQDDEVLLEKGYGVTVAGEHESVDEHTVFRLASLSKAFASTVAALLVSEGALSWDTRVADHLPAFKLRTLRSAQTVTVADLLSHRLGLPYNTGDKLLERDEPYPLLVAKLGEVEPMCETGDCYGYQNIAFSLIGDMVFAVSGDFYSHQVEKRIFHPLGMLDSTYGRDGLENSQRWARPHVRRGNRWVAVQPRDSYYRVPPAAGVNASIHDLGLWLRAQLGLRPDVLPSEVLQAVQTPRVATPYEMRTSPWRRERLLDAHYALGWRIYDYLGHKLVFHAGAVQGYRGMIGLLPERGFGFVAVWNSESPTPSGLLATALDQYLGVSERDFVGLDSKPSTTAAKSAAKKNRVAANRNAATRR